jgi:hypothetical protein
MDTHQDSIPIDAPISSTGYDESVEICRVSHQDEPQANARLIAAAPELLEALEALALDLENNGEVYGSDEKRLGLIHEAIARARGDND